MFPVLWNMRRLSATTDDATKSDNLVRLAVHMSAMALPRKSRTRKAESHSRNFSTNFCFMAPSGSSKDTLSILSSEGRVEDQVSISL
jgi:hypothetical protein